ncbi:hypothetical protein [Actinomyces sp. ZJ308]|uniref:hypothetical protein n=1 Tax=Actinomyces sp. ZJ308 TaxID=2708342 RepID=UPI00141D7BD4|nr:hypothetical protein [Actinomyces sp. ZJ308]
MRATRAALALTTVLILAGCSQSGSSSAGPAGTTTSTPASATTASSGAGAATQPGAGASGSAGVAPSIPAGHQAVTAPTVGITFAVPEDWQDLNALTEAQKTLIARVQGVDPSTFSEKLSSTDAFYGLFSPGSRSFNSAAVAKEAETSSTPPSQASLDEFITQRGGTPTGYATRQSTYGEAAIDTSTAPIQGIQTPGAVVAVPTSGGTYARIAVTAGTAEEVDAIVSTIIETAH